MPNYLAQGADILHARMSDWAGVQVTYVRGRQRVGLTAVPGRVLTEQAVETSGAILREVSRDFIVRRSDLAGFDPPKPQRNDEIRQMIDGEQWVFTVNGDGSFVSHYEEADSYGVAWRIHTKRDRHA